MSSSGNVPKVMLTRNLWSEVEFVNDIREEVADIVSGSEQRDLALPESWSRDVIRRVNRAIVVLRPQVGRVRDHRSGRGNLESHRGWQARIMTAAIACPVLGDHHMQEPGTGGWEGDYLRREVRGHCRSDLCLPHPLVEPTPFGRISMLDEKLILQG